MLTNFDHDRQWFNTLIPPSHKSTAVYFVEWTREVISTLYTTPDIHCRDRWYECDSVITGYIGSSSGIRWHITLIIINFICNYNAVLLHSQKCAVSSH